MPAVTSGGGKRSPPRALALPTADTAGWRRRVTFALLRACRPYAQRRFCGRAAGIGAPRQTQKSLRAEVRSPWTSKVLTRLCNSPRLGVFTALQQRASGYPAHLQAVCSSLRPRYWHRLARVAIAPEGAKNGDTYDRVLRIPILRPCATARAFALTTRRDVCSVSAGLADGRY